MTKFFARFNNYYDVDASNKISADVIARLGDCNEMELSLSFKEIETVQNRRAEFLKNKFHSDISKILGKRIIFIGDSITKDNLGYRTAVTRAANLNACNLAVSGTTSPMLLYSAKQNLTMFPTNFVSIMIGTNDSILIGKQRLEQVSILEYKRNVSALVRWSKEAGAKVLLFEVTPVHETRFAARYSIYEKFQTNENVKRYNDVLYEIAEEHKIPLNSNKWLLNNLDIYYEPDGIHLSESAHEIFAEKWLLAATK